MIVVLWKLRQKLTEQSYFLILKDIVSEKIGRRCRKMDFIKPCGARILQRFLFMDISIFRVKVGKTFTQSTPANVENATLASCSMVSADESEDCPFT